MISLTLAEYDTLERRYNGPIPPDAVSHIIAQRGAVTGPAYAHLSAIQLEAAIRQEKRYLVYLHFPAIRKAWNRYRDLMRDHADFAVARHIPQARSNVRTAVACAKQTYKRLNELRGARRLTRMAA